MISQSRQIKIYRRKFEISTGDNYVNTAGEEFEPAMTYLYESLVQPDMVVCDVGSNVGMTTLCFSQMASKVYSFEPSFTTYAHLQQNVRMAEVTNVVTHNFGLSNENRRGSLVYAESDRTGASLSVTASQTAGHVCEEVELVMGDIFLKDLEIKFIKIDVEGYEMRVLDGLKQTLQRCMPITVLEMNHFCLNVLHKITLPEYVDSLLNLFPILVGIQGNTFIDLRDNRLRYKAMYDHVNRGMYYNLVGMFTLDQSLSLLKRFAQAQP